MFLVMALLTSRSALKIFFISLFVLSVFPTLLRSQPFVQKFDGIPFTVEGQLSQAPFNGGMNNARYQFVDIDADGDFDLFTYDADTSLYFYRNTGTPQSASYKLNTNRYSGLSFANWFYFADMDSDSDYDLFTGGIDQTVKYYKNTGSPVNASFVLEISELRTVTDTVVYSEANCVPVLCDMDNDGDKDFFTGQSLGTITYYENIGTASSFSFRFVTDFWQDLIIISPAFDNRHGANSLEFVDIDNDQDYDLFWGDLFSKGIYFIRNDGTPSQPNVVIVDSLYPSNSSYESSGYNSTRFVDIDADGDKDLFISVLYLSQNSRNFTLYRNNGSASNPQYERVTDNYLRNVDVGGTSNPAFVDIDNDSDKDIFVGNDYAKLGFFRNEGTTSSAQFNYAEDSLNILSESFNYSPSFADLDNDGDKDMILGSYIKDSLWFFRNTGSATAYNFMLEARGYQIGLSTLGQSSTPALVDIDADQDFDLFIGGTNGRILYYENTGNAGTFNFIFRSNFYSGIDAGDESTPRFADTDRDGDFDLFIGKQDGRISFYRNNGSPASAVFDLITAEFAGINAERNSCPEFVDIDNDLDLDLFVGNSKGGLYFYRNDEISSVYGNISSVPEKFIIHQNYPNPFNPSTVLKFEFAVRTEAELIVTDISGKVVSNLGKRVFEPGVYEQIFESDRLSSGIYFFGIRANGSAKYIKMLFVK